MNPLTQINFISIKPGKIDEFIEAQRKYFASTTRPKGLIGSRVYRSVDGKSAVLVTEFESVQAQEEILQRDVLKQHINSVRPLVESSGPSLYEEAHITGDFR